MLDKTQQSYTGRFAPSPTGPVHFGTLIAAVGSYLQAKKNRGRWLMRIEDIDITRKLDGADTDILNTLEKFGFEWDDEISYQSQRTNYYQQSLDVLISQDRVFPCVCTRKLLAPAPSRPESPQPASPQSNHAIYPGNCRHRHLPEANKHSIRLIANDITINFVDAVMGSQSQNIKHHCGDFIIKRRDDLFAYQLAVVVDDALQNITEVVRGADLLDSTPRQIYLQQLLQLATPEYCHLPLAVDAQGNKISKSQGAAKIDLKNKENLLVNALCFLSQCPPHDLDQANINDIWSWAIAHWDNKKIAAIKKQYL